MLAVFFTRVVLSRSQVLLTNCSCTTYNCSYQGFR